MDLVAETLHGAEVGLQHHGGLVVRQLTLGLGVNPESSMVTKSSNENSISGSTGVEFILG